MRRYTIPALLFAASLGLTACSGSGSGDASSSSATSDKSTMSSESSETSSDSSASSSSTSPSGERDVVKDAPSKDWKQALDAAHGDFSGDPSKIELESAEGGRLEYKIELLSKDTEYTAQFDANSLKTLSNKQDDLGDDAAKDRKKTFKPGDLIDLDKAVKTARGKQDGKITSWKVEGKDDGTTQYEFDIRPDGAPDDTEVQINAKDGSVIKDS